MNFHIDFADPRDPAAPRMQRVFGAPRQTLVAHTPDEVRPLLRAVEAAARGGHWCVGGVRYEAASAFDAALSTHQADGPLAWFAVFDAADAAAASALPPAPAQGEAPTLQWADALDREAFDAALHTLHEAISAGTYYQVNYTAQRTASVRPAAPGVTPQAGDRALFAALRRAQPGGYAACLTLGDERVLSVSPELFFDWRADAQGAGPLLTRPMKGTAPRGATAADDAAQAQALRSAPKERAENVMIVDLLRNDLSRVAQPHSVQVPRLFHTEALPTVWQMTSDVVAHTRPGTTLEAVFAALFPCGSITGAPKGQAMRAIRALEPGPRGYYCGAIGLVRPADPVPAPPADGPTDTNVKQNGNGNGIVATFNVPIRTLVLRGDHAACGIGSGITSGAQADAEWREWRHKRAFADRASAPFDILETLALQDGQLRNAQDHLVRMASAAAHFGIPWYPPRAEQCLQELAQAHPDGLWRVRLLLDPKGQPRAQAFAMPATAVPVRLALAQRPLAEAHGEFVRFKTTRRAHYAAFEPPADSGVFDTVLYNEEGEITECTRGNIAMQLRDGRWVTPPLSCGLLPGIGRAVALREGRVTEAVVRLNDMAHVQAWAFLNSLRGWLPAGLEPSGD